ncbi:SCO family protein [Candidatus Albibeggiatoa sp. nov. NOAA]|uniref:SCO family protein n=1 Tax=Candidatus Albibeggiatoa sp. nov. NOAA TaxID=3162724 RepID=UPI0032FE5E65|nr:SCO family protein [Thiotrichaceae bacterium]
MRAKFIISSLTFILLLTLVIGYFFILPAFQPNESNGIQGMLSKPQAIKPFELTRHDNQPLNLDSFKGKWTMLFFGYTHCPDICPMALSILRGIKLSLDEQHPEQETQFVFVSVDGKRDTPEQLSQYITFFHPEFIGATGDEKQVNALTRQLNIVYMKMPEQEDGSYIINHSSTILLVNPGAQLAGRFSTPHDIADIIQRYIQMRQFAEEEERA